MKIDAFFGQLAGNEFPPRPVLHGETISFKPTKNLELSFGRMAELGGVGRALTLGALWHSYVSTTESIHFGNNDNPGKRTSSAQFSYRLPFVRNWLTLYTDLIAADEPSPLSAPRRSAMNPGIYLTHFPKIAKLDLRVEGVNTNTLISSDNGRLTYFDFFYHDLSTNKKNLIGSWIGREGQGIQAWSNYWFGSRNSLQFGYRHAKVASDFVPGGETLNDGSVRLNWWIGRDWNVSTGVQYERWLAPVLAPGPQTNWTSTIGISFQPHALGLPLRPSQQTDQPDKQSGPQSK
jgi:hypothetical protein